MNTSPHGWIIAAAVFFIDLLIPLGYAVPMFYVLPILLAGIQRGRAIHTILMAGSALLLTWVGAALSPGSFTPEAFANRAMVSAILVTIGWLLLRHMESAEKVTAAQASEFFITEVLNSLSAHVCVLDRDGVIIRTNEPWERFARANADATMIIGVVGDDYFDLCRRARANQKTTVNPILSGIEAVLAGRQRLFTGEYAEHSPDEAHWALLRVSPLIESHGVVLSYLDITHRKCAEEALLLKQRELERSQTQLELLTAKLLMAQETERQRLARDLHDDITQRIAALAIDLQSLRPVPAGSEASLISLVHQAGKTAEQITTDLQRLAHQLHPSLLEHAGLEAAVLEHLEEFRARTGLKANVAVRNLPATFSLDRATCLYRVLQEGLQNVRKHANAAHVLVRLLGTTRGVGMCIHDDGRGFDVAQEVSGGRKGLGIISLQERVGAFRGTFRIKTKLGEGTEIHAWVPLRGHGSIGKEHEHESDEQAASADGRRPFHSLGRGAQADRRLV